MAQQRDIPEPTSLMVMGLSFFYSSRNLMDQGDKAVELQKLINAGIVKSDKPNWDFFFLMLPAVVNRALAAELFLKAIHLYEEPGSEKFEFTHNLKKLFEKLKPDTQAEIIDSIGVERDDFLTKLEIVSDEFVKVRYMESGSKHMDFVKKLTEFLLVVCLKRAAIKLDLALQNIDPTGTVFPKK